MTPEHKLVWIWRSLHEAGIDALVMGGHAVRYYGVDRNTVDYDLVTSITSPDELRSGLSAVAHLAAFRPEPVWRSRDFARFEIGKLSDGREEWLEFWIRNHLLEDFSILKARAEMGSYGGESIPFLGLSDLMKSKETERESDWQDIGLLEEIQDDRNRVTFKLSPQTQISYLSSLRSRRGMEYAIHSGLMTGRDSVAKAAAQCEHPVTYAFLQPFTQRGVQMQSLLSPDFASLLTSVQPGSTKHFAVVEIVRRDYKRKAMDRDRADKQRALCEG